MGDIMASDAFTGNVLDGIEENIEFIEEKILDLEIRFGERQPNKNIRERRIMQQQLSTLQETLQLLKERQVYILEE
jgi:hypothetical protein